MNIDFQKKVKEWRENYEKEKEGIAEPTSLKELLLTILAIIGIIWLFTKNRTKPFASQGKPLRKKRWPYRYA